MPRKAPLRARPPGIPRVRGVLAILLVGLPASGCASEGAMPMEPELVLSDPPAVVTGRVLAADTFRVPATDTNFQVQPFSGGGTIPADIGPSAGKLLVLSLRDASRPNIVCTGGIGGSNCAILVALPSREEGFVSVASSSGRRRLYLQSTFQLDVDPEPS